MAPVIFARHGESTANLSHTFANRDESHPLTALGRTQADDLARRLESVGVTRLVGQSSAPRASDRGHRGTPARSGGGNDRGVKGVRCRALGKYERPSWMGRVRGGCTSGGLRATTRRVSG